MDINKIYNALQSLPLSVDQKNTLYNALFEGSNDNIEEQLNQLKNHFYNATDYHFCNCFLNPSFGSTHFLID